MKVKIDFVTNSSTTSFCGFGSYFDISELKEMIEDLIIMECPDYKKEESEEDDYYFLEFLDEILEKNKLSRTGEDGCYIGEEISLAPMHESKQDIKDRVELTFRRLGLRGDVDFIQEAWRDG